MKQSIIFRASVENAFYFSFAVFVLIWIAGFLYKFLEKTTGRLSMGVVILIVLGLVLVMFSLALLNIILSDEQRSNLLVRLAAVFLFALISVIILLILGALFWYPF